jgi:hypothetical protein
MLFPHLILYIIVTESLKNYRVLPSFSLIKIVREDRRVRKRLAQRMR